MEAIQKLDDLQREIVMLRIFGELSFKKIATLVNKRRKSYEDYLSQGKTKNFKRIG